MHHVGFHYRKRNLILGKYIGHREFSAVCITSVGKIHFSDFIRIGLHQNRNACVLQGCDCTVFVRKNRHGKNHAIVPALMFL